MKIFLCFLFFIAAGISTVSLAGDKVLVYTKNGEGYVHDNIEASVKAIQKMCAENRIAVDVSDDPSVYTKENIKQYNAIIFANTNEEGFDHDDQRQVFKEYIQQGGGFIGIHSACNSEHDWPWFYAMVGGRFLRHPRYQAFDVVRIDKEHLSTSFLPDVWKWEDECYYVTHLNPDIKILLAVDLRTIEDAKTKEYPGNVFGDYFPLAWYHTYDGGRQFYTALGHKIEHYTDPLLTRHILGGILWVLGRD